jgi:ABC-type Fe3+ transport system substrate-binding protein
MMPQRTDQHCRQSYFFRPALFGRIIVFCLALYMVCSSHIGHAASGTQEKTKLYILSATDTDAMADLLQTFQRQHPDITVVYRDFNTNVLHAEIQNNITNPDYDVDIVISSAMDLQVKLVNEGLAHAYDSPNSRYVPSWAQWRKELYGFTYEPVVIAYNRALLGRDLLPKSHAELASMIRDQESFFLGRIGTYDIASSGTGYLFASQDAIQGDQFFRLIESLGRAKAKTYTSTARILDGIESGDLILGYNLIGSYALERARNNPNLGISVIRDYTLVMFRTAFIHKNSKNIYAAQQFIDFLLAPHGQQLIAKTGRLIPIHAYTANQLQHIKDKSPLLPIKLGVSLLTYQDSLKKHHFLKNWESSIHWDQKKK